MGKYSSFQDSHLGWCVWNIVLYYNFEYLPKTRQNNENNRTTYRSHITFPYNEGLSESMKNIGKKYGIQVHFKSGKTLNDELVAPKDKDDMINKSGIIYRFKCNRLDCDKEYIGETARTFGERFKEHLKTPSPIHDHSNTTGHTTNINNFSIVGREEQNLSRLIKESMFIRVNNPSLNKNIGKTTNVTWYSWMCSLRITVPVYDNHIYTTCIGWGSV